MRPAVFVDTSALIALTNPDDALNAAGRRAMADLRSRKRRMISTEFVLLELADAFAAPASRGRVVRFVDELRRQGEIRTLPAETSLFAAGWALFGARPDKAWSLTDCISFAVMGREGIATAFTSDHHFEQAGFAILLGAGRGAG